MKSLIFLSGYNQRAVFALLRICRRFEIDISIIANGPDDPVLLTDYASDVKAIRKPEDMGDFLQIVQGLHRSGVCESPIIMPTTEYLNRWLLEYRDRLPGISVPLPDKEIYDAISDKAAFYDICKKADLLVPESYDNGDLIFPCMAKAAFYEQYRGKPILLRDAGEYRALIAAHPNVDWVFNEYVDGDSYYLLYCFPKSGTEIRHSQRNIVQQPDGRSILAAVSADLHRHPVADAYADFFRSLEYTGPVMVELKESAKGFAMIEANPRPWGPSQLVIDAHAPIFETWLRDLGCDIELPSEPVCTARYFWENGFEGSLDNADYFSASPESIKRELLLWRKCDVLRRPDTLGFCHLGEMLHG